MNSRSTNLSTNENQKEFDILEEQFMQSSCKVEDIPLPKKQLDGFEFEIREIMKSGCNRQIAEYSLLKCEKNDIKILKELKSNYRDVKNKIRKNLDEDVSVYINDLKEDKKDSIYDVKNLGIEDDKNCKDYEEEADEIMEEKYDVIEANEKLSNEKESIKNYIMNKYKHYSDVVLRDEEFFKHKKAYKDKRDAILEAALRIVKKVVNDEIKYDEFYKEYKTM